MSLALLHQGGQEVDTVVGIVTEQQFDDLLLGIFHHFLTAGIRIGFAGSRIEQAEEVVDFGDRADGGTGIFVGGLLLNADHRREPADLVHVGTFEVVEKITRVGRKGLDVSALTLGIDGVEGQRRLSAPAQSGDHRERMPRNVYIDILEVVHAGTEHLNFTVLKSLVLCCHVVRPINACRRTAVRRSGAGG